MIIVLLMREFLHAYDDPETIDLGIVIGLEDRVLV